MDFIGKLHHSGLAGRGPLASKAMAAMDHLWLAPDALEFPVPLAAVRGQDH
jgi:hypothetical protein